MLDWINIRLLDFAKQCPMKISLMVLAVLLVVQVLRLFASYFAMFGFLVFGFAWRCVREMRGGGTVRLILISAPLTMPVKSTISLQMSKEIKSTEQPSLHIRLYFFSMSTPPIISAHLHLTSKISCCLYSHSKNYDTTCSFTLTQYIQELECNTSGCLKREILPSSAETIIHSPNYVQWKNGDFGFGYLSSSNRSTFSAAYCCHS